jgi:hypothetical protein
MKQLLVPINAENAKNPETTLCGLCVSIFFIIGGRLPAGNSD